MSGVRQGAFNAGGSGTGLPRFDWMGIDRQRRLARDKGDSRPSPTAEGMTSTELFNAQLHFTWKAANRLLGVGADQYDKGERGQRFEFTTFDEECSELQEELMDVVNYCAFLSIKIERLRQRLADLT